MSGDDIDKLEAGRLLDALVVERVLEWKRIPSATGNYDQWEKPNGEKAITWSDISMVQFCRFKPSTDIAAAWEVVEKMGEMNLWTCDMGWGCGFYEAGRAFDEVAADTAPLAICRAALRAVRAAASDRSRT